MYISFIYILFIAEALLILLGLSILFGVIAWKRGKHSTPVPVITEAAPAINLGSSYIEHLDTEISKTSAQQHNEALSTPDNTDTNNNQLLHMRDMFLQAEREAAQHAENESLFWTNLYESLNRISEHFRTVHYEATTLPDQEAEKETHEQVFYIETQGKKIDGEVNRLKDIIFEQENTLSGLMKALKKAEDDHGHEEDSEMIALLRAQVENFERQLRDSKMCMEVLELENSRLLDQVHEMEGGETAEAEAAEPEFNVFNLREMIDKQEQQIARLTETIVELELTAEQSEKLKMTINEFARSSQEMMSCITILEEENERLKSDHHPEAVSEDRTGELSGQIRKLEEEIIKKDVAYAQLQDEFSSMEKEYLAMYNAIHGEK